MPEGATVGELLRILRARTSNQAMESGADERLWRSLAVAVNREYSSAAAVLRDGDEVALLPPVSGGCCADGERLAALQRLDGADVMRLRSWMRRLTRRRSLPAMKAGGDGAVCVFDGIVRDNTRGRRTLHLDYEAYREMALEQMQRLAADAVERFGVRDVAMVHRLGRLMVGETSVLIVVASAHRGGGVRCVPLADRYAEEDGADLEEGDVCGRRGVGGWRAVSGGDCAASARGAAE